MGSRAASRLSEMAPDNLISIARHLAAGQVGLRRGRPRQTDLCRAVSAAYYALFHTLARCGADLLAGATRASRSQPAWEQIYRALEHGHAKNQCQNRAGLNRFPPEIQDFAEYFVLMQRHRHQADYAPTTDFSRVEILKMIEQAEEIVIGFSNAPANDRRAFAIYALFRQRGE